MKVRLRRDWSFGQLSAVLEQVRLSSDWLAVHQNDVWEIQGVWAYPARYVGEIWTVRETTTDRFSDRQIPSICLEEIEISEPDPADVLMELIGYAVAKV